jgi:phenylacetic acid degradation operon negative regulatory protein
MVHSVRRDGQSGYALSANSVRVLADGDARIFGRRRAIVDDGWVLVAFSVPEMQRERRHVLRSLLIRLGFGSVSAGVWIAPAHLEAEARAALHRLDLTGFVDVFRSQYVAFGDPQVKVATWWDLDELTAMYGSFIERFRSLPDEPRDDDGGRPFRHYVPMLTAWRRLPYSDPGLPLALLPSPWNGSLAEELFNALDQALRAPAQRFAARVIARDA